MATANDDMAAVQPDIEAMSVNELRRRLEERGLPTSGSGPVLRERLRNAARTNGEAQATHEQEKNGGEGSGGVARSEATQHGGGRGPAGASGPVNSEDLSGLTVVELQARLRSLKLLTAGKKAVLQKRLRAAMADGDNERDSDTDGSHDADPSEFESRGSIRRSRRSMTRRPVITSEDVEDDSDDGGDASLGGRRSGAAPDGASRRFVGYGTNDGRHGPVLTFRDVEDALEVFSGEGRQNVRRWLTNFEETADLCDWSDMQRIIYAKRLLRGSAKLFVAFESGAKTWQRLREALLTEFATTLNSKQVHRELALTKKRGDETCQEYVYRMLEIASHADIEEEAKIQYIIDGVPDDDTSKMILYGATTIKELRKRLTQ